MTIHWGDAVGLYGAAVATIMAILRWFEFRRDRQSLRVSGRVVPHPSGRPEEPPWVVVTVTNVGRRAVQLRNLGVVRASGQRVAVGSDIGVNPRLDEGQEVGVTAQPHDLFGEEAAVHTIYVEDTHGRAWAMPKRTFRKFRDAYRSAAAASDALRKEIELSKNRKWLAEMVRKTQMP